MESTGAVRRPAGASCGWLGPVSDRAPSYNNPPLATCAIIRRQSSRNCTIPSVGINRRGQETGRSEVWLVADYADGIISLDQLSASVQGWVNHVRYGNTVGLRKAVLTDRVIPPPRRK